MKEPNFIEILNMEKNGCSPAIILELYKLRQTNTILWRRFHQIGHLGFAIAIGHVDPGLVVVLLIKRHLAAYANCKSMRYRNQSNIVYFWTFPKVGMTLQSKRTGRTTWASAANPVISHCTTTKVVDTSLRQGLMTLQMQASAFDGILNGCWLRCDWSQLLTGSKILSHSLLAIQVDSCAIYLKSFCALANRFRLQGQMSN